MVISGEFAFKILQIIQSMLNKQTPFFLLLNLDIVVFLKTKPIIVEYYVQLST